MAERTSVPLVQFDLLVDAGYAADQHAAPGTASLMMNAMDEGTASRSALEISAALDHPAEARIFLMDRPGSAQSILFAGHVAPPTSAPNNLAVDAMNAIFGGTFTSRINMNLREDKSWSFGASSLLLDAEGQRPFIVYAPVQTDKTAASMQEIVAELTGYLGDQPATSDELAKTKNSKTLTLPGRFETIGAVSGAVRDIVRFGLPDDHYATYADAVRALSLDAVAGATQEVLRPDRLTWVVVGDREQIEPAIRALDLGPIRLLDSNGQPMTSMR